MTNNIPKKRNELLLTTISEKSVSKEVAPYDKKIREKPKSKKQEKMAPKTKYFKPASVENSEFLLNVART